MSAISLSFTCLKKPKQQTPKKPAKVNHKIKPNSLEYKKDI